MTAVTAADTIRRGPAAWLSSYLSMVKWVAVQQRTFIVAVFFSQLVMGVGMAVMYRFYLGELDGLPALYLVSGIPALTLIPVGMILVPITVMQDRTRGTEEFTWSLPVPRLAPVLAVFTVYSFVALPVTLASVWIGAVQFGVDLAFSWAFAPVALLASLVATSIGYGVAQLVPEPRMIVMINNVVIFFVLFFSPILIPLERFPVWLQDIHQVLPFFHIANLLRSATTDGLVISTTISVVVLTVWAVASWAVVARLVSRRR